MVTLRPIRSVTSYPEADADEPPRAAEDEAPPAGADDEPPQAHRLSSIISASSDAMKYLRFFFILILLQPVSGLLFLRLRERPANLSRSMGKTTAYAVSVWLCLRKRGRGGLNPGPLMESEQSPFRLSRLDREMFLRRLR